MSPASSGSDSPDPGSPPAQPARPQSIRLDQFLKVAGLVDTGGQAKLLIQDGEVRVNDEVEQRRRRQLVAGDCVLFDGEEYMIDFDDE